MEQKKVKIPKPFIFGSLVLALVVFVFAIANGNQPILSPDLDKVADELRDEMVSSEWLASSLLKGDAIFRTISLRSDSECVEQLRVTKAFDCFDKSMLDDAKKVRGEFRDVNEPLVIMGTDTDDGLRSAAGLKHWGYKDIKVLEGGFGDFELEYLMPEYADVDIAEADTDELQQLAIFRYFTGNDPLVKRKGETWAMAMGDSEEEMEGVELGEDDEEWEEDDDDDWDDFEDYGAEEGC